MTGTELAAWVMDARERTFELVADLTDEQLLGPQLPIVNPLLWEIGHLAWFQEKWVLRHALGEPPVLADSDALYDSMAIPHDTRWGLPLPSRADTLAYMRAVRARVVTRLMEAEPGSELAYFVLLTVFHEDMHTEAFTYTRQTHGYAGPKFTHVGSDLPTADAGPLPGDAELPRGVFAFGAPPDEPFVFDNEKWVHPVDIQPFAIARAAVTQADFAAFVDDGGYRRRELWDDEGWAWRSTVGAEQPLYWRRSAASATGWQRRVFDEWVDLEPHRPVIHVNWYEADAYCRWAGRRLPAEPEWEMAASWNPATGQKYRFPWGSTPPTPERANVDWRAGGTVDVGALPEGDSPCGCRQMLGNVWEWTSTDFGPYPGFVPDPYKEYSEPWFGDHKVLRGGCWATRSRLIRNTWRNFYPPHRRDVWAGFRTCAL